MRRAPAPLGSLTNALILINVLVYFSLAIWGNSAFSLDQRLLEKFGQFNVLVIEYGHWWQLLTSMFVHINLVHLGLNMFWLYVVGQQAEGLLGNRLYSVTYVSSGLLGNVFSLALSPYTISAGASGAVFGLVGANLMAARAYGRRPAVYALIIAFLVLAVNAGAGINVLAHLGGLLMGIVIGLARGGKIAARYGWPGGRQGLDS